ncbi:MAG: cysteine desulfurase [Cyclobacteriaceae bacterium]|nr:cysteine desulfurase [Cyclobacteriaceae bacterium]
MQVYLDNAATTPLDAEVISAVSAFMKSHYGNPSSVHAKGREARVEIEKARKNIASIVDCKDKEIIFTSGGTEANNAVLKSIALSGKVSRIISSPIEHHSILDSLEWVQNNTEVEVVFVSLNKQGDISLEELEHLLQEHIPTLVSLMHGNNEIGNMLDLISVGNLCRNNKALFHTDMVQTLGHLPISLNKLPIDYASASAHKVHGPKGIGFIYTNSKTAKLEPFLHGGAQERSIRAGTENGSGIIGMSKAYEVSFKEEKKHQQHLLRLKEYAIDMLKNSIPDISFIGNSANLSLSLPNIINIGLPGDYNDTLLFNLDLKGVFVSEGSACSSGASEGSHVTAVLLKNEGKANNLRLSFSKFTTIKELDYGIKTIAEIVNS